MQTHLSALSLTLSQSQLYNNIEQLHNRISLPGRTIFECTYIVVVTVYVVYLKFRMIISYSGI